MEYEIKKVLIIGSGYSEIGGLSQSDSFAVEAIRVLHEKNIKTVVLSSNPFTLSTELKMADAVYIEPLNLNTIKNIVIKEKPDAILPTAGGEVASFLVYDLLKNSPEWQSDLNILSIDSQMALSILKKQELSDFLHKINEPQPIYIISDEADKVLNFSSKVGYPVQVGKPSEQNIYSGLSFNNSESLNAYLDGLISRGRFPTLKISKSYAGWRVFDFEGLRDKTGKMICVSCCENIFSVEMQSEFELLVSPATTLSKNDYSNFENALFKIMNTLSVVGNCGVTFAKHPYTGEYIVLNIKPYLSETSSFLSCNVGFSIARAAVHLAAGDLLVDLSCCSIDTDKDAADRHYCVNYSARSLNNKSLQTTDIPFDLEITATGDSFSEAYIKIAKSLVNQEKARVIHSGKKRSDYTVDEPDYSSADFLVKLMQSAKNADSLDELSKFTKIEKHYLEQLKFLTVPEYLESKKQNAEACPADSGEKEYNVDFCSNNKTILIIGANAFEQSKGLDYCNTRSAELLHKIGYKIIIADNRPDVYAFSSNIISDICFSSLNLDEIINIINNKKPGYIFTAFSGANQNYYTECLKDMGIKILGPDSDFIKTLTGPEKLKRRLMQVNIPYMRNLFNATLFETVAISDGETIKVPAIIEYIDNADICPEDSISVYPTVSLSPAVEKNITEYVEKIIKELGFYGLLCIQFSYHQNKLYVSNINVTNFYLIPFLSKVTGLSLADAAVKSLLSFNGVEINENTDDCQTNNLTAVRIPVFKSKTPERFCSEYKSTGEVVGIASSFEDALLKGLISSGMHIKKSGGVLITVRDSDKYASVNIAEKFMDLGFELYATAGTAKILNSNHIPTNFIRKISDGENNILDSIENGKLSCILYTTEETKTARKDDMDILIKATEKGIPTFSTLSAALAYVQCLKSNKSVDDLKIINIKEKI